MIVALMGLEVKEFFFFFFFEGRDWASRLERKSGKGLKEQIPSD